VVAEVLEDITEEVPVVVDITEVDISGGGLGSYISGSGGGGGHYIDGTNGGGGHTEVVAVLV
jgi:hypothetical protein